MMKAIRPDDHELLWFDGEGQPRVCVIPTPADDAQEGLEPLLFVPSIRSCTSVTHAISQTPPNALSRGGDITWSWSAFRWPLR